MAELPYYRHLAQGLPETGGRKPLLVFLHGRGERGHDLDLLTRHGPPALFPGFGLDRFLLVSPQCPDNTAWDEQHLKQFVSATIAAYPVEPARVYLTGISMGGVGAWELGTGDPDVFAALVPICGGGDPHRADRLVTKRGAKPVWLFHSARDRAMPVEGSDRIFDGLRARDGYVTYTRYDDLDHVQTWERAYGSSVLYDWLLAHSLPGSEEYAATDLQ